MGSPDPRQIDGMGGADPLTSKVAVVAKSQREGIDVDYLFLQVFVDQAIVSDAQNCGNILAGIGPFAIERGLVAPTGDETRVSIHMENTGQVAVATVETPGGTVNYAGEARIDGVPGSHAPIPLEFRDTAGSSCGALLPTGNPVDEIEGVACTLIDNGMPCIVFRAEDVGATGYESREELESDAFAPVRQKIEAIRLAAGPADEPGRRERKERAQDDAGRPAPPWRRGDDARVHPAPRTCLHRRAGRGDRRDRVPGQGIARGRGRRHTRRARARPWPSNIPAGR